MTSAPLSRSRRLGLVTLIATFLVTPASHIAWTAEAVRPLNGRNLDGWKLKAPTERSHWKVAGVKLAEENPSALQTFAADNDEAALVNTEGRGVDVYTEEEFGDVVVELEFMVPKGSNSGVYMMGEYEVQIFDSYGKEDVGAGDVGGLYGAAAPRENAAKAPGQWQTLRIDFQAPRFEGDRKVQNAHFRSVSLNGKVIHENVEMKGPTPSGLTGRESQTGPLMFQGDHGPVAYRRIHVVPQAK